MSLPTIGIDSINCATVNMGPTRRLYFSYRTLIGFSADGKCCVRENRWGPTTGRHMARIDGGSKEAKRNRLDPAAFEEAYLAAFPEHSPCEV